MLVVVTAVTAGFCSAACDPGGRVAGTGTRDVIANLFEWNWHSVGEECRTFLGPAGYGYVQVSPPQEHINGKQWWVAYQPVSYRLESRKGTRVAFADMVRTCGAAGVKVIVDAVVNHMADSVKPGPGWAGSRWSHYDYPGIYQYQDFHHCGRNGDDVIVNYNDRYEVQNCELVGLADLDTASQYVRDRLAAYLNDLLSLGVFGFRIDAAKHIPASDLMAIKAELTRPAYLVQEVIFGAGEPITPQEYTGVGDVHNFRYGRDVSRIFRSESLGFLRTLGESWGYIPSASAVVFIDNHDTQRGDIATGTGVLTYRDNGLYALANAFMLAWPYGTPTVMSSFDFTDKDQGPPSDETGRTNDTTCFVRWRCEHRWQVIANMVGFHNAVAGTPVVQWYDNGANHIAFGRGGAGYLTINNESSAIDGRWYHSQLPAGRYCDVVHGDPVPGGAGAGVGAGGARVGGAELVGSGLAGVGPAGAGPAGAGQVGTASGGCTGPVVSVNADGWFKVDVAAHDAVALHIGARQG